MLIGLTGKKRCGKSSVARILLEEYDFVEVSFAAPLYRMLAAMLGQHEAALRDDATKDAPIAWLGRSPRYLLQTLGTEWGRNLVREDIWLSIASREIERHDSAGRHVVVSDVRFPNEAALVRSRGGELWRIVRPSLPVADPHESERGVPDELITRRLANDRGIAELRARVREIMRELGAPS